MKVTSSSSAHPFFSFLACPPPHTFIHFATHTLILSFTPTQAGTLIHTHSHARTHARINIHLHTVTHSHTHTQTHHMLSLSLSLFLEIFVIDLFRIKLKNNEITLYEVHFLPSLPRIHLTLIHRHHRHTLSSLSTYSLLHQHYAIVCGPVSFFPDVHWHYTKLLFLPLIFHVFSFIHLTFCTFRVFPINHTLCALCLLPYTLQTYSLAHFIRCTSYNL